MKLSNNRMVSSRTHHRTKHPAGGWNLYCINIICTNKLAILNMELITQTIRFLGGKSQNRWRREAKNHTTGELVVEFPVSHSWFFDAFSKLWHWCKTLSEKMFGLAAHSRFGIPKSLWNLWNEGALNPDKTTPTI